MKQMNSKLKDKIEEDILDDAWFQIKKENYEMNHLWVRRRVWRPVFIQTYNLIYRPVNDFIKNNIND